MNSMTIQRMPGKFYSNLFLFIKGFHKVQLYVTIIFICSTVSKILNITTQSNAFIRSCLFSLKEITS